MCGIVGYIGSGEVVPLIVEGLRRLEYRGYDSAGVAVVDADGKLTIRRAPGKLKELERVIHDEPLSGTYGISFTVTDLNNLNIIIVLCRLMRWFLFKKVYLYQFVLANMQ